MKNPIVNMFVAHYHFWFLKFRNREKACHTALLFIALMLTLFETTVLLLVGGRFLQLFLNMGAAVLILALAANMAAYYFLLRLSFTPERALPPFLPGWSQCRPRFAECRARTAFSARYRWCFFSNPARRRKV